MCLIVFQDGYTYICSIPGVSGYIHYNLLSFEKISIKGSKKVNNVFRQKRRYTHNVHETMRHRYLNVVNARI